MNLVCSGGGGWQRGWLGLDYYALQKVEVRRKSISKCWGCTSSREGRNHLTVRGPCRQLVRPLKSSVVSHPPPLSLALSSHHLDASLKESDFGKRGHGQLCGEGWGGVGGEASHVKVAPASVIRNGPAISTELEKCHREQISTSIMFSYLTFSI